MRTKPRAAAKLEVNYPESPNRGEIEAVARLKKGALIETYDVIQII
jgi:hypothetical protein